METAIHYPIPVHRHPPIASSSLPVEASRRGAAASIVSLPLYPELTDEEATSVASAAARTLDRT